MSLIWLVLAAIAIWALVRLGRQGERRGRGQWRVAATLFSAVMLAGGVLLAMRGAWLPAGGLIGAALWLT
ncbi:MAG: molecular chaperone DnaJ, partial [Brevundimonas sp.]|nr:molecular chaperone DnaJ [Brevundimonas sp.]